VFNARWNRVTISGFVDLCLSADGKFDLAFDNRPPLSPMRMRGEFHIFKESEKGHQAIVRPDNRCLNDILGERHFDRGKRFDKVWIRYI